MASDLEWARRSVSALLRKLMRHLAESHEKAAAELRRAAR
jgi:GTP1/Obg family GTP-binding protein